MNNENYNKVMDQIKISEDFKERTEKLMKDTRISNNKYNNNSKNGTKKNTSVKKIVLSAASVAVIIAASAAAMNITGILPLSQGTTPISTDNSNLDSNNTLNTGNTTSDTDNATDPTNAGVITLPVIELPTANNAEVSTRMMPLFVYKGRIYLQSNTVLQTSDGMTYNKEDVENLRGDYLGKTIGSLTEWSKQEEYATEFASTMGEAEVYTVKGYDSEYRLMVYYEWDGGFSCEIFDSFGGLTLNTGADYFDKIQIKDNITSYQWENLNSWNNGLGEKNEVITNIEANSTFMNFIDSLYTSIPLGDNTDMLIDNTEYDSQKFIYIKNKDNLITSLRLLKDGYVYVAGAGLFQVDYDTYKAFWDTMPVTGLDSSDTTTNVTGDDIAGMTSTIQITANETTLPVGSKALHLTLKNNGSEEIFYGVDYSIEKLNGAKWEVVPGVTNLAFIEIVYILSPESEQEFVIELQYLDPSLDAGNYRVVKTMNGETIYVEFEMTK